MSSESEKKKKLREALVKQATQEIAFSRRHKQNKIANWQLNEKLYYGVKPPTVESRANVDLGRGAEFVHSYLSKIDNPLKFKYAKRKESQLRRVKRLNALRDADASTDFWDLKDIAGKKQCLIYGRSIFGYHADSLSGYKAYLENVDVYDFLIDPSAGGLDIEKARYLGRYGVVKDASELRGNAAYIKSEVKTLLDNGSNAKERTQEEINKQNRRNAVDTLSDQQIEDKDKFVFWEWFTTYEGERYYLLMQENGRAIRVEKLVDIFPATKHFPLGAFPFWTYAAAPDISEFWTPAPMDQVREIFMVQNVNINQMLDNVEEHNKPMKVVDVGAIENLAELKYRKGGYIKSKTGFDVQKAIQFIRPSTIDTPLRVFEALEGIQEKASGLTAGAKGVADGEEKVGIYEGNQANAADRFGLMNKSYAFGYKRFAQLYELGVRTHLTKKVAVDIIGPSGIETEEISKRDIFRKDEDFTILTEASNAEEQASEVDRKNKLGFLSQNAINPVQNPKKSYELGAKIAGFSDDEIKELLDTSEFGDAMMMAEAARDIETILDGKPLNPNRNANLAYKQKFVDYMKDHEEDMSHEQFMQLARYVMDLEQTIMANTARAATLQEIKLTSAPGAIQPDQKGKGAPPAPPRDGAVPLTVPANNGENAII